jgi:hypothetical protein
VRVIAAGVLMLVAASVLAAAGEDETSFAGFTKYERYRVRYEVDGDGRHVETHAWTLRVLSDPGIAIANRASVSFSDRMQKVDILARIIHARGRGKATDPLQTC